MGFRFKIFDYVGVVAPWTWQSFTNSASDAMARSQAVFKDFGDFILSCGKWYQLDTGRNVTISDFVDIPITLIRCSG